MFREWFHQTIRTLRMFLTQQSNDGVSWTMAIITNSKREKHHRHHRRQCQCQYQPPKQSIKTKNKKMKVYYGGGVGLALPPLVVLLVWMASVVIVPLLREHAVRPNNIAFLPIFILFSHIIAISCLSVSIDIPFTFTTNRPTIQSCC